MRRAKSFLEQWGIHALLLPLFFLVHTYKQYYGLVSASVVFRIGWIIFLVTLFVGLLLFAATRQLNKALQLVTLFSFVFLFFGVIKDFLHSSALSFLSRYSVLLPILAVAVILLSGITIKKKNFGKNNLFQNVLLIVFLLIDISQLFAVDNAHFLQKNLLVEKDAFDMRSMRVQKNKPDIYYLVFDSYPGTSFLAKYLNFDNTSLINVLSKKGFYVVSDPKSNYNRTAFSIASTLNFQYLKNIASRGHVRPKDYAKANLSVKKAMVPRVFEHLNYKIYNLSVFDIDTIPPIHKETFLTIPEDEIVLYNTFSERIRNDLLWNVAEGKYAISFVNKLFAKRAKKYEKMQAEKNRSNQTALDSLLKLPFLQTSSPKFVYAHFYLPHPPFFYNENGKPNDLNYVVTEASLKDKGLFLSYLKYTNKVIEKITETISRGAANDSIVILESDHGFRDYVGGPDDPEVFFENFAAFYFPDRDYSTLYDTLSNLNTFPIIFNKYFGTHIPMKKDSSIYLAN